MKKLFAWVSALALLVLSSHGIADKGQIIQVKMETNMGDIVIDLYPDKAPKTVENFLRYVDEGFYEDTVFHRVISTFMIQGGGFDAEFRQKPTRSPIDNEADNRLSNLRGTIAMARTADPHSASAQFFINVNDNINLDFTSRSQRGWGYAVFGKVSEGMEVVDAIRDVPTGQRNIHRDVPIDPVIIQKISRLPANQEN